MSKTILITGATSGFGKACARLFATHKWQLILCGRREEKLQELKDELLGTPCHIASFDVQKRELVQKMQDEIPENFKNIDVLVNNAGLALGLAPANLVDIEDWEIMVDTNIKGLLYMTRLFLPWMVERGGGHIINLGSIAGNWPYPGGNTYGATKAFVQQFSRNLRADLVGKNIRVTNIEPGMAETEFSLVRFHGNSEQAEKVYEGVAPLVAEDIAESIFWAVSRPAHVNINSIELMPTNQAWGPLAVHKDAVQEESIKEEVAEEGEKDEKGVSSFIKRLFS